MQTLASFNAKLITPCKRFIRLFRLRFKRPVFIRAFRSHRTRRRTGDKQRWRWRSLMVGSIRWLFRRSSTEEMDRVGVMKSMTERDLLASFPSPLTPAHVKLAGAHREEEAAAAGDEVEEACRSFENYLAEMIVEEGKVRDLRDVEELLYCWGSLKSPVFIDLVSRFYGELCKDLFSVDDKQEIVDDVSEPTGAAHFL